MNRRMPFVATVVGALVIGGATTGTTLALWRDEVSVGGGGPRSGTIELTAADGVATSDIPLGSVSNLPNATTTAAGAAVRVSPAPVLRHDTPSSSKNMRMHIYIAQVGLVAGATLASEDLQVAADATTAADCTGVTFVEGDFRDLGAYAYDGATAWQLTTASLAPQTSVRLCIDVRVRANRTGVAGKSGDLLFTFRGQQVRTP